MFSLKLNSLKCQSSSETADTAPAAESDADDEGNCSDHTYERLPHGDRHDRHCECNTIARSPRTQRHHASSRRISRLAECQGVRTKVATVTIDREDGTLGITLRGGCHHNKGMSKPIVITHVKAGGPADREGTIKAGDRLLAVDGQSLQGSTFTEAQSLLKQQSSSTQLTVEYDINVLDSVEHASGPLLVEVERPPGQELGLTLFQTHDGVIIEMVKTASIADRCGALHVGDEILAVNNTRLDGTPVYLEDVEKLLDCQEPVLKLEILPAHSCFGTWKNSGGNLISATSSVSALNTLRPHGVKKPYMNGLNGLCSSHVALTHSETLHTTIAKENGTFGIELVDSDTGSVVISALAPGGPAERSQCLQPGDRILSINHRNVVLNNLTSSDIRDMLEDGEDLLSKLNLHTEFDVLHSVVPDTGIFTVRLAKLGSAGLGITIAASKSSGFQVCEMKKGSVAHRAGSLMPGDKLLAINDIPLEQCSIEYAAHVLHHSVRVVALKVQRDQLHPDVRNKRMVTYTVELQRYAGPLGITIAGSEEPFQPITVSGLTPGGLAQQTGVLHVGDEILAINNHVLYGEPLSKAHHLLQTSPDLVTLKVSRCMTPAAQDMTNVISWGSAGGQEYLVSNLVQESAATEPVPETQHSNLALLEEISNENIKIKKQLELLTSELDGQCIGESEVPTDVSDDVLAVRDVTNQSQVCEVDCRLSTADDYVKMQPRRTDEMQDTDARDSCITTNMEHMQHMQMDALIVPDTREWFKNQYLSNEPNQNSVSSEFSSSQLCKVTLYKDPIYEDFGFSVSDGLYERGVFINRIRRGGPADLSSLLKPFDRILQVNETYTQDFDCCLTVPLIAAAGDSLQLLVARPSLFSSHNTLHQFNKQELSRLGGEHTIATVSNLEPTPMEPWQRILV